MDWQDIEAKLQERAEDVCRHLLPNGKREGAEYVCGSLSGESGKSLKVNLAGKVGTWRDFAGDKGGKTLISLWCSTRGQDFKVAIREVKDFLGIRDDFERRVRSYPAPAGTAAEARAEDSAWKAVAEVWKKCAPLTEGGPVWNYLVEKRRLDPSALDYFQVREMALNHNAWAMVFPYWVPQATDGKWQMPEGMGNGDTPTWLKFERLDRPGGKKQEWTSKGPEKCLWGMPVARLEAGKRCQDVLICEGEKDALSWATYGAMQWGVLPVSVPFGAKWKGSEPGRPSPNREWLDRCWEWLQGFQQVYVAMDSDEAGRKAAGDIIAEIGPRRCRLVQLPEKALAGGHQVER